MALALIFILMIHPVKKPQRIRDPDYLAHIRTMGCLLHVGFFRSGDNLKDHCDGFQVVDAGEAHWGRYRIVSEAAHVRGKGAGGGDEQVVPLCGKHHRWGKHSLHNLNVAGFDKYWNLHVRKIARELRQTYVNERIGK